MVNIGTIFDKNYLMENRSDLPAIYTPPELNDASKFMLNEIRSSDGRIYKYIGTSKMQLTVLERFVLVISVIAKAVLTLSVNSPEIKERVKSALSGKKDVFIYLYSSEAKINSCSQQIEKKETPIRKSPKITKIQRQPKLIVAD